MDPISGDMHGWYCGTPLLGCYLDAAYSLQPLGGWLERRGQPERCFLMMTVPFWFLLYHARNQELQLLPEKRRRRASRRVIYRAATAFVPTATAIAIWGDCRVNQVGLRTFFNEVSCFEYCCAPPKKICTPGNTWIRPCTIWIRRLKCTYMCFVHIWKKHSNLSHVLMKCGFFEENLM